MYISFAHPRKEEWRDFAVRNGAILCAEGRLFLFDCRRRKRFKSAHLKSYHGAILNLPRAGFHITQWLDFVSRHPVNQNFRKAMT